MTLEEIVFELEKRKNPKNISGMARFGINPHNTLGISVADLREIAKKIKKEERDQERHLVAGKLWGTGIHEAKILATFIDPPLLVTEQQLNSWVKDLDSWDVCDQLCISLVVKTPFAFNLAKNWVVRKEEFVRRAGFSLIATLAVHRKEAKDKDFEQFLPWIKKYSVDERNFVKKSVNWALRQIGKRNKNLLLKAIELAQELEVSDSKSARWVGKNALVELKGRV